MKKENVKEDFIKMIKNSWTYERLTKEEKKRIEEVIYSERTEKALKGSFNQRWQILQAIYMSFLSALGYQPMGWREKEELPF